MGRRKIEIKPIRDDRNRSVTFLKRKGGLFKKAHELSVLCSVDVAVVIFGHNKKLYEYSSSDINEILNRYQYYGGAHEHKGPADFVDRQGGGDDDDDDEGGDEGEEPRGTPAPEPVIMNQQMQSNPNFQHLRHGTPSGSPPTHNGAMPQFQRGPSPLPPGLSRPASRASHEAGHIRRPSSNLAPQAHPPHPQHAPGTVPPPGYAYMPNPPFYNPQNAPQLSQRPPHSGPPGQATYPPPYPPGGPQMQAVMMQDSRRSSLPASMPAQPPAQVSRHPSQEHLQPPPHPQSNPSPTPGRPSPQPQHRPSPSPQPLQHHFQSPPMPQPKPLPTWAKQTIFTPIDDSRSMLAQHWGSTANAESSTNKPEETTAVTKPEDTAAAPEKRPAETAKSNGLARTKSPRRPPSKSPRPSKRPMSETPVSQPPTINRSNTGQPDAKRPRLKVQIPSEQSGDEGGPGSAPDTNQGPGSGSQNPAPSHGVVLPPPSPSTTALLSAGAQGAQGPPNPFARPAPPISTNPHAANREAINNSSHVETPISALPSRFMSDNLLPSPSTFYPDWGFGRSGENNMLPSPLNFQTPVAGSSQGWREDEQRKKTGDDTVNADSKPAKA